MSELIVLYCFLQAMTIYCYYRLIRLYSDYQKGTVQRLDDVRTQDFPAVTFCNVNPITSSGCYSSSGDVQQLYDIYEQYMVCTLH